MRRHSGLLYLLCALLLLLVLSALVEAPESSENTASLPYESTAIFHVALAPVPAQENYEFHPVTAPVLSMTVLTGMLALIFTTAMALCRDANGRWIRKRRYVDSVYQVFRQEAASG